jgi:hypothetical protein
MRKPLVLLQLCALTAASSFWACGASMGPGASSRPPLATGWLDRAKKSYRAGDFDDAHDSAAHAIAVAPNDVEARELAAHIALVRLEYADVLRLTEGLASSEAHSLRGRAYWLAGDIEHAADELETLLSDPAVKDPWARDVASLARRGVGRHPFQMDGGNVGAVEMPRMIDRVSLGAANVVPCDLDGERILALVGTGSGEILLDSNSRHEPAWVSLRFDRVEVNDVPALVEDLSPISRQLGVPIKALIGGQFLRHAHVTVDRRGDQFVVRRQDATPPPDANRVQLFYLRGGGMMLHASISAADTDPLALFVDSLRPFPLMLEDDAWRRAGVDVKTLPSLPDEPHLKRGVLPMFRVGGFDLAKMPALQGADLGPLAGLDVDLAGVVGADLLAFFRMTFADDGRFMWIEPDPTLLGPDTAAAAPAAAAPAAAAPAAAAPAAPPAAAPPPAAPRGAGAR